MKNGVVLCLVAVFGIAFSSASFASTHAVVKPAVKAPAVKAPPSKVAPLDEYFGKMKLSPLGINNTIHDTNLRVKYDSANAGRYYQGLAWAEDALRDWARKYPNDTWLPGRAYYMSHVFWQMHTPEGDAAAERCRTMLFKEFQKSHWAVLAHNETKDNIAPVGAPLPAAAAAVAPVNAAAVKPKPPKI
jgi:TolA-binding protein